MRKAQKFLIQSGTMLLCINGVLWGLSTARDGDPNTAQLLFRIGVFLFSLLLLGAGAVLALINKLDRSIESKPRKPEVVNDDELFD